ncbi:MAG: ATP-binding cassette domain-containing protein [Candidatus Humimicrobiaceae bacterium]
MSDNSIKDPSFQNDKQPLIKMVEISKHFDGVVALNGVNFEIGNNEIIGLIGDNGAGKSTLVKILTGFVKQDKGQLYWKGKELKNHSVEDSRNIGIETVYQDRALAEKQTIWRNLFMGREKTYGKTGFIRVNESKIEAIKLMKNMIGLTQEGLSANLGVRGLSGGEKQGVAIARALYFNAELIILDEPTNNLSLRETKKVLDFVREIKKQGKSCIFITHSIYNVFEVADKFVILDRGRTVAELLKQEITLNNLIEKLENLAWHGTVD